ncbi:unnamed protein product [Heterobilharzia americana]|nr:unnamed protein product [Heterobilharzia americana]
MEQIFGFREETQNVLPPTNAPPTLVVVDDQQQESDDYFEAHLPTVLTKEALDNVEVELGLSGGGDWWVDPSRDPIEVNSEGKRDEGAILDVEVSCKTWCRTPFDRDPRFCNDSYHLLNQLNDLAKSKGSIEAESLKKKSHNHSKLRDATRQICHSTLSLNASIDFDGVAPSDTSHNIQNTDPQAGGHRSLSGSFKDLYSDANGTYILRKSNNKQKMPLGEAFVVGAYKSNNTQFSNEPEPLSSQASHPQPPEIHRSLQPPLPHSTFAANVSPVFGRRKVSTLSNQLFVPSGTGTPDQKVCSQKRSVLSRTYSKEQMDVLKEANYYDANDLMPKVAPMLSRCHALTASLPISDNEGDIDVTKSLDIPSGVNPLSQSLSATELVMKSLKLSEKGTASFSSMRSSDVFELARLQETHLREHSGSRSKLGFSNSSLNGSSTGGSKNHKGEEDSADSNGQKSGSDLSSCNLSAAHSREEVSIVDTNGKPERQHTITANENCYNPLLSSLDSGSGMNFNSGITGTYDSKDSDAVVENKSSSPSGMNSKERNATDVDNVSKPEVDAAYNTSPPNSVLNLRFPLRSQATHALTRPTEGNPTSQSTASGTKPFTRIPLPTTSSKINNVPMPSQKMPSMSISSRVGPRKSGVNEQKLDSNSVRSVTKTQSLIKSTQSGVNSVSSNSIKTSQLSSNPTTSFAKPLSSTVSQKNRSLKTSATTVPSTGKSSLLTVSHHKQTISKK